MGKETKTPMASENCCNSYTIPANDNLIANPRDITVDGKCKTYGAESSLLRRFNAFS